VTAVRPRRRIALALFVSLGLVAASVAVVLWPRPPDPFAVVLDTDIGTDVDDALALASLVGSDHVDLVGVTTVYGDTVLRARIAAGLMSMTEVQGAPVVPGEGLPRSSKPIWTSGDEERNLAVLPEGEIKADISAAQFLVDASYEHAGELFVIAVGPSTNIAAAIELDPAFAHNVRQLLVMGGDFGDGNRVAEHNFASDAFSAAIVFESDLSIVVAGLDMTTQTQFGTASLNDFQTCGQLGAAMADQVHAWWRFLGQDWNNPHDPTIALWLTNPSLFVTAQEPVEIMDNGLAVRSPSARTVTVLTGVDSAGLLSELERSVCSAGNT